MYRDAHSELAAWHRSKARKPLIILGARQVGKTYLVTQFGEQAFPRVHVFNFEREPRAAQVFAGNLRPERILADLGLLSGKTINTKTDLLFFDEIQAAPRALTSLKHFCQETPELALCAAGSLLGIHLAESSFPVGYVDWLHLLPMSFGEFLAARASAAVLSAYRAALESLDTSLILHDILWNLWREYLVTGGLPEVIASYLMHEPASLPAFEAVRRTQQKLINAYLADVAKHCGKVNALHIERTWAAVPRQIAAAQDLSVSRFRFKDVLPGTNNFGRLAGPIDWLAKAGLILQIPVCERAEIPLSAFVKSNHFKIYMFDVGLLGAMLDLPPSALMAYDFGTYKGYVAENFVAQALRSSRPTRPIFGWTEGKSEIEFLLQGDHGAIPVEVKAGSRVRAQSLRTFIGKYSPKFSMILSGRPLSQSGQGGGVTTQVQIPLYLAELAWRYAE